MNGAALSPLTGINVAIGKPASQSSLSRWSKPNDAAGAVTGVMPGAFAFHTEHEPAPWWMVDLLKSYKIERIVIHNRLDQKQDRASSCLVDISEDGASWRIIFAGEAFFSGGSVGPPLILPLGGQVSARFVRISLTKPEALHLAQVEVFAAVGDEIRRRTGLANLRLQGDFPPPSGFSKYSLEGSCNSLDELNITGFRITAIGRLGNQLMQLINAICLAKRLGVKYIVVLQAGMVRLPAKFSQDGIEFIANPADAGQPGLFLAGNFFHAENLSPILDTVTQDERYRTMHGLIIPYLLKSLPVAEDVKYDDELTVHFRAGDLFQGSNVHGGYVQPPLAFYKFLVRRLIAQRRISRVRVVYEDRGNPCVDAFIAHLENAGIAHRAQSRSLAEDLAALVDAPLLAFGHGTFGLAAALLSRRIDTVYCFEGGNADQYESLPSIRHLVIIRDIGKAYIKFGHWGNRPEQRQLMLDYPESALTMGEPDVAA